MNKTLNPIKEFVPPPPANGTVYTVDEAIYILSEEIDLLVERLELGERVVAARKAKGLDYSEQEDKWIGYLREYEKKCDERRNLGYPG